MKHKLLAKKMKLHHEWLQEQIGMFEAYEKSIVDVDLKIDIEQHRKALEDAQPDV